MNVPLMAARKRRGLTQKQLASKIGVGTNHFAIVLIERYGWIPPTRTRRRLATALGSTDEALFGEAIGELTART